MQRADFLAEAGPQKRAVRAIVECLEAAFRAHVRCKNHLLLTQCILGWLGGNRFANRTTASFNECPTRKTARLHWLRTELARRTGIRGRWISLKSCELREARAHLWLLWWKVLLSQHRAEQERKQASGLPELRVGLWWKIRSFLVLEPDNPLLGLVGKHGN